MSRGLARRRPLDIWPGFVDALAALLMVVIFVLLVFTLGQFFLGEALQGRDRALQDLNLQMSRLADMLALEELRGDELEALTGELRATLTQLTAERDAARELGQAQRAQLAALNADLSLLQELKAELEAEVSALAASLDQSRSESAAHQQASEAAQAQLALLNRQMGALREQLSQIAAALKLAREDIDERDAQIEELGRKLNLALASEVQRLARYQSEFFGRLKEALGDNPDLRIVGDRFVFQSELLFDTASADLGEPGKAQVRELARTLEQIIALIPADLDWVLRIDGHTDARPIATGQFPSNWELSTARALAIVRYLIDQGIPPHRLAATGFGSHHPLDTGTSPAAYARNRRIELKLTSR